MANPPSPVTFALEFDIFVKVPLSLDPIFNPPEGGPFKIPVSTWTRQGMELAEALSKLDAEIRVPIAFISPDITSQDNELTILARRYETHELMGNLRTKYYPAATPLKPVPGAPKEAAFFLLSSEAYTRYHWRRIRVQTPLVAGNDLGMGRAQLEAFANGLRTVNMPLGMEILDNICIHAGYQITERDAMSVSMMKKVISLVIVLELGLFKQIIGTDSCPPHITRTDRRPGLPHSSLKREWYQHQDMIELMEQHIGPVAWRGYNKYLPVFERNNAKRMQAEYLRCWLTKLWSGFYGIDDIRSHLDELSWSALSLKMLPGGSYVFSFRHLDFHSTPEVIERWMVIIRSILEHACLEDDDFKALMQQIFKLLHSAPRDTKEETWRYLLGALGLQAEIPFWADKLLPQRTDALILFQNLERFHYPFSYTPLGLMWDARWLGSERSKKQRREQEFRLYMLQRNLQLGKPEDAWHYYLPWDHCERRPTRFICPYC